MALHRIWLLRLVFPFRYGRWITGFLLLSLLALFFHLGVAKAGARDVPVLFFSLIIAYIIPVFSFITARSREALQELRPILDLDKQAFEEEMARLDSTSLRHILLLIGGGALFGFAHLSFIRGSVSLMLSDMVISRASLISTLGTVLVWVVMTTVIAGLIRQASLFARLGAGEVRISLLNTGKLLPFARVAITSSLAVIGALALFPLIIVESDLGLAESLPGAIATSVPLLLLFTIPVWPVHRRIAAMKEREIASLDGRIEVLLEGGDGSGLEVNKLEQLAPLLDYRREISRVSTWPFDASAVTRLSLYLIIPPLTWAGSALIQNLVDTYL